jgi:hypothetical protein
MRCASHAVREPEEERSRAPCTAIERRVTVAGDTCRHAGLPRDSTGVARSVDRCHVLDHRVTPGDEDEPGRTVGQQQMVRLAGVWHEGTAEVGADDRRWLDAVRHHGYGNGGSLDERLG